VDRVNVAIIGSGNIGTDLMIKALRSERINPVWLVGIDPDSEGLAMARERGLKTTHEGVSGILPYVEDDDIRMAFDATSAYVHPDNAEQLESHGVLMIDLTPAAIGPYCVPVVNLKEHVGKEESNVNLISCGGQATIPIAAAVARVQPVEYAEIIATVASKSAGPGTRKNIDEFTRTTAHGLEVVAGARTGKAIIILNPAEPPLIMRDTVHCLTEDDPDGRAITESIMEIIAEVQTYVPGYRLVNGPVYDGRRVSIFLEVEGLGDYLPKYSGNLDIMTAAALKAGEMFADEIQAGTLDLPKTASA
jgi:acetaldehyde/propanal dehydrogenase